MRTVTSRVETPFGSLYVHMGFDDKGVAREFSISTPGKHHDTTMGEALIAISEASTALLQDLTQAGDDVS